MTATSYSVFDMQMLILIPRKIKPGSLKLKKVYRRIFEVFSLLAFIGLGALLPLYLVSEKSNSIEINSDNDFKKFDLPGVGTANDPYILEDLTISDQSFRGISISNTNKFFVIRNCYLFRNLLNGIRLDSIAQGTGLIYNNTIVEHPLAGILISNSHNITVQSNTIIESKYMIWLNNSNNCNMIDNSIYAYRPPLDQYSIKYRGIYIDNSEKTLIENNYIKNVANGIYAINGEYTNINNNFIHIITQTGVFLLDCSYTEIKLTTCLDSTYSGFYIRDSDFVKLMNSTVQGSEFGLRAYNIVNNSIEFNIFEENDEGMLMYGDCKNNSISNNEFTNNEIRGVRIDSGSNNLVHHNSFFFNNQSAELQAEDNGTNNTWFDELSLAGNYWHGWNSSLTYQIIGSANSSDPYPLSDPIVLSIFFGMNEFMSKKIYNLEVLIKFVN